MKKYFALIVFAALAAVSCTDSLSEDKASVSNNGTVFTLRLAPITKATVDVSGSTYDLKWTDGDKIAFKLSDDSTVESSVSVSGSKATVSVDLTGGKTIVDAWYPSNGMVKLTAIPASQSATSVNVPLELDNISGTTLTFRDIQDWAVVRVTLSSPSATRIGDARTLAFVKIKNNNGSALPDQIQINSNVTLSDTPNTFDFVVPADECKPIEIIVRDSNGKEYRRKMSSNQTLESHKLYTLPEIADIDDTGKHIWYFGSGKTNADESPLNHWFISSGTPRVSDISQNSGYMTVQTLLSGTKYRADIAPIAFTSSHVKICSDGENVVNSASDADRLTVHVGNYPIFAIKMTNQNTIGTARNYNWDTNSKDGDNPVTYRGSLGGPTKGLTESDITEIGAGNIVNYWDLTSRAFATGGLAINYTALKFYTWQLKFADIVADSTPSYNVYWAGFFNSVSELEAFAAAH